MSRSGERDWRTPAVMLAAGAVTLAVSLGIRHAFGLFLAPMSRDNGWTREVFAFAIALQNLVWGAAQPFAGRLADRHGAGKAILAGSALYVAGLLLMAQSQSGSALAVSAGLLIGFGLSGTTFPVVFGAIARSTPPEKRSLAMGVAMSVGSLGHFAMLPGALSAIEAIAVPLTNGTVATVFGVKNMAMLGGIVFFFHQIGAFLGGWLGGRLYVGTGSYDVVWWISIALAVVAALLNVPVREVPVERLQAAPEAAG